MAQIQSHDISTMVAMPQPLHHSVKHPLATDKKHVLLVTGYCLYTITLCLQTASPDFHMCHLFTWHVADVVSEIEFLFGPC